jgi:hypothetical protein
MAGVDLRHDSGGFLDALDRIGHPNLGCHGIADVHGYLPA